MDPIQLLGNRYRLREILGEGGFAMVFSVWDTETRQLYAVKAIGKIDEDLMEETMRKRDLSCSKILLQSRPKCQFICWPKFVRDTQFFSYIFLPVLGPSLQNIFELNEEVPFSIISCLLIVRQQLKAIAYLNRLKLLHRDVTAGNVALTSTSFDTIEFQNGRLHFPTVQSRLCDMGCSIPYQNRRSNYFGSRDVMAREMLVEEDYTYNVDVWAVGLLAYRLYFWHPLIEHGPDDEMLEQIEVKIVSHDPSDDHVNIHNIVANNMDEARYYNLVQTLLEPNKLIRVNAQTASDLPVLKIL